MQVSPFSIAVLSTLVASCSADKVQVASASVSEVNNNEFIIELFIEVEQNGTLVHDGDVGYIYVFECDHEENFKVFGDPIVARLEGDGISFRYEIGPDQFLRQIENMCGQYRTTGYSLFHVKTDIFRISTK